MKYIFLIGLLLAIQMQGQVLNIPLHSINECEVDRMQVLNGDMNRVHTLTKPVLRDDVLRLLDTTKRNNIVSRNNRYLIRDNSDLFDTVKSKKPFLKYFYTNPRNIFEWRSKDFYFNINPVLYFRAGFDNDRFIFRNTRGAKIQGHIQKKLFFYVDILETQQLLPGYVNELVERDNGVPSAGFFKGYNSLLFEDSTKGYDYLLSNGYISFQALKNHITFQLGHGQHFWGDGQRSLFLSDQSTNYFYLKINTKVWRLNYQNLFARLTQNYTTRQRAFDEAFPVKYLAAHHLSFQIRKNLQIGIFEGVIFSRNNQFDLQYLNPLIFYRSVEQAAGSPDNVMLGLNWKWNFLKRFSFYGQFVLDELAIGSIIDNGFGWWGNKFGIQAGLKYFNVAEVDHLDAQIEFNMVRPYMYSFRDSSANWTHYNQFLAHPLGSNFYELIAKISYQPIRDLYVEARCNYLLFGADTTGVNMGGNPHIGYNSRTVDTDVFIGQGELNQVLMLQLYTSYQVRHNLSIDLDLIYRKRMDQATAVNDHLIIQLGLRWNFMRRMYDY